MVKSKFKYGLSLLSGSILIAIALAQMYKWKDWYRRFVHCLFFKSADFFG